ncbi:UNVERIFIED_CONTAM: Serine carboxypeptidase 24 [Sesamum calycinum]|uniref:Serine carboxypeptidase 24 n=1 Tax=Sesamum calycinum TaxID=2727403 RepID=A0AAW2RT65_9LAMI
MQVGNAVTDRYHDRIGTVTYWWSHSIISDQTYKSIMKNCNFKSDEYSEKCEDALYYAQDHEFGNIDHYSIYTPSCNASTGKPLLSPTLKNTLISPRFSGYDPALRTMPRYTITGRTCRRPCMQILPGFHINGRLAGMHCDVLGRNWKDSEASMLPTYKKLIAAGLRIWVFSGDTDAVVPVTATRLSLSHLNLKIKVPWYPWYSGAGQVGGWTEVYDGLTFATVRGAGHEVPLIQPRRGFILFRTFLSGNDLPKS